MSETDQHAKGRRQAALGERYAASVNSVVALMPEDDSADIQNMIEHLATGQNERFKKRLRFAFTEVWVKGYRFGGSDDFIGRINQVLRPQR